MPTVRASGSVSTRFPAHSTKPSTWRTRLCTPPNGAARNVHLPSLPCGMALIPFLAGIAAFRPERHPAQLPEKIQRPHAPAKGILTPWPASAMSVLPAPEIEGPICLRTREKPPPSTARGGDGSRWESFAGTVPGGGKRLGPPGHPKAPPQPAPRKRAEGGPVPHATARFPATAYGFRRRVDGFLRKAPGARCVPHPIPLAPERALAAATS